MAERNNPKTYYNQTPYSNPKVSKPDEVSYPPPPPYSTGSPSASSSHYSPSAPPSTYVSAQDYPSYGALDPNRPGYIDPRSPYQQPIVPSPLPEQGNAVPDANSPAISHQYNPHLPRDWVPDRGYSKAPSSPPQRQQQEQQQQQPSPHSRISIPGYTRRAMENSDPGCCKKWCKYMFIALLVWLVILKYNGSFQFDIGHGKDDGHVGFWQCKGKQLEKWTDLPSRIDVEQDLYLAIEGPVTVSGGFINIHPANDRDMGWIESQVMIFPRDLFNDDELYYRLEKQDDETRLVLHFPPWNWERVSSRPCVKVSMNVYLPDKVKSLRVNVNNLPIHVTDGRSGLVNHNDDPVTLETDRVELFSTNARIRFDTPHWEGDTMALSTTNADINIAGTLEADKWIRVQSTNGMLVSAETIQSKEKLELMTTNGKIFTQSVIVKEVLHVVTTNAAINLQSRVSADQISIQSTNGPLKMPQLAAETSLQAITTNDLIDATVVAEKDARVDFSTSNSPIVINMTKEFEGQVSAKTSRSNKVLIDDDNIRYDSNQKYYKQGQRFKGDGDLSIKTTNGDIRLAFTA